MWIELAGFTILVLLAVGTAVWAIYFYSRG